MPFVISIHAPHAGRDAVPVGMAWRGRISIHAPHAGRDSNDNDEDRRLFISIHAPHAGRDRIRRMGGMSFFYFNPRAPCGARL